MKIVLIKQRCAATITVTTRGNVIGMQTVELLEGTMFPHKSLISIVGSSASIRIDGTYTINVDNSYIEEFESLVMDRNGLLIDRLREREYHYSITVGGTQIVFPRSRDIVKDFLLSMELMNSKLKHAGLFKYYPVFIKGTQGFLIDHYIVFQDADTKCIKNIALDKKANYNNFFDARTITGQCKFKVKDYIESAKLFKFTELKKSLVGSVLNGCDLELDSVIKASETTYNTVKIICPDGRKSRFLLSDLDIIYPNISSFNPPKNRTVRVGSIAKISDDRRICIPKNTEVKVVDIKRVGNKQYALVSYNDKNIYTKIKSLSVC